MQDQYRCLSITQTAGIGCVDYRGRLAMSTHFVYARRAALAADPGRTDEALEIGARKARTFAQRTLGEGHKGLWRAKVAS